MVRVGKSGSPDGINTEVLKNCDLKDIILEFCNLARHVVSIKNHSSAQILRPLQGQLPRHQADMDHCESLLLHDIKQGPASNRPSAEVEPEQLLREENYYSSELVTQKSD